MKQIILIIFKKYPKMRNVIIIAIIAFTTLVTFYPALEKYAENEQARQLLIQLIQQELNNTETSLPTEDTQK